MTETIHKPKTETRSTSHTERWISAARWGAITVVAWALALQVYAGAMIPPVVLIGVVFAMLAFFLKGERRRLGLTSAILGVLTIFGNFPQTLDELMHPESAPAFILTLLAVVGATVVVAAGLAAFRGWSPEGIKAVAISASAIFAIGVIASLSLAATVDSDGALSGDIEVTAHGVEFDPGELTVTAGETGFWVDNLDGIRHTFTIDSLGFELEVPALSSQRAEFELDEGQYIVTCAVPGHENMRIDLTVEG